MLALVGTKSRSRFVRGGLLCVLGSVGLAVGCEAFQAADDVPDEEPTSLDGSADQFVKEADVAESDAPVGEDVTPAEPDSGNDADTDVNPCAEQNNGKVIDGVAGPANTCCDGKLTDLHTSEHCGGCKIKCPIDPFDGTQTQCAKAPSTGNWACTCVSTEACPLAGYGASATCYPKEGEPKFCNCQCPNVPLGTAGTCSGQCSDGMICNDLKNQNPNPCSY